MRFQVGEMARVVVALRPGNQGTVREIALVGPFKAGTIVDHPCGGRIQFENDTDYVFNEINEDGRWRAAKDWQLAKLDPPAEPVALTRRKDRDHARSAD